ncbi:phospholipase, putative [Plasmodium berghei]|uniref:Phospholipase DDHD1, putative n=2 Tax=Plasmodium berghei TaxID=5821 RepID=A0A509AQB2_PLABA|nr:phospholipase DDHD1, putative [Plasmodium berghei ANKA]CXJ16900.1 phospholipase, putative [Plasmodium berghei]SCM26343.1 phospholipase, putative [Plasmodium berghei]SCN28405.1 phospholipase, putative [Plasmodium berghei]SCO62599.1 phospholipase, putative [Plasmodium berghei]SCO64157.1 phospholipase, putative [Plasmodium berghei]|eukprot:XP_034424053.1 phospholipase DDHD1, putative [Plasmodium berghei ANKA]
MASHTLKVKYNDSSYDNNDDNNIRKKNKNFFFPKDKNHINRKISKDKNCNHINFYEEEPYLDDKINDVDYIILIIHGIGSNEDLIINQCEDLKNSFKIVKKMWFFDYPFNIHFHIFNWKKYIIDAQIHVFNRININTMTETRKIINLSASDIICFLHPRYGDYIMLNLYNDINKALESLKNDEHGRFKHSKICLLGYSLGSAMAYEILHNVKVRISDNNLKYELKSKIDYLFMLGSPLSALLSLYKPEYINDGLKLIDDIKFYNIFHGFDPVAFRIEPLIYPKVNNISDPILINYWRNNGARYWFEWDKNMQNAKIAIVQNLNDITSAITNGFYKFLWKSEPNTEEQGTLNKNLCYNKCESKDINMFLLKVKENQRKIEGNKHKKKKKKIEDNLSKNQNDKNNIYHEIKNFNQYENNDSCSNNTSSYVDSTKSIYASQDSNSENSFFDHDFSDISDNIQSINITKWDMIKKEHIDNGYTENENETIHYTNNVLGIQENHENHKNNNPDEIQTKINKNNTLPIRYDYQLQEFIMEHYIYPLAVAKSHFNYFIIKDISFFILKELIDKETPISYEEYLTEIEKEYNNKSAHEKDNTKKEQYQQISLKASKLLEEFHKFEKNMEITSDPFNIKNFKNLI